MEGQSGVDRGCKESMTNLVENIVKRVGAVDGEANEDQIGFGV